MIIVPRHHAGVLVPLIWVIDRSTSTPLRHLHLDNQALHQRRLRIEHVNSSVKRCRIVKDRSRLWKEGVRDLVMELCCALHNFRVRLSSWLPMI